MASLKARSAATARPRTTTLSTKKQSIPHEHTRKKRKGAGSTHRHLRRRWVQKPRRGARSRAPPPGGLGSRRPRTPTTPASRHAAPVPGCRARRSGHRSRRPREHLKSRGPTAAASRTGTHPMIAHLFEGEGSGEEGR
jgi:hypothetical protein